MTRFDSSRYDIPTLIEKLRDQRFDGYDPESLADEVEKFRDGAGTASIGNAVESLKSVVNSLANTDATLRKQLAALGVTWQSEAGGQASVVLTEQAGFAGQAYDNVSQTAQLIFDQGEAFNRTKNKLPDPSTLRQGEDGYTFGDTVFGLFGFETDHASAVQAGDEARAQAVEALNAYAHDSGNYLASSQAVPAPQVLSATTPPPPAPAGPGVGSPQGTAPVPDLSPTSAAGAKDVYVAPQNAPAPRPAPVHVPEPLPPPAAGIVAPPPAPAPTGPQSTAPSSAALPETPVTGTGSVGGYDDIEPLNPGRGGTSTGMRTVPPGDPGQEVGGIVAGTPGGAGGPVGAWGKPGPGGGVPGGGVPGGGAAAGGVPGDGGADAVLRNGKMVGSVPLAPSANPQVGPGFSATPPPVGVGGAADSATAIGAGVAGGAVSGEEEHRGRGIGRSTAAERGKPVHPLDVGDLPEEEEVRRANRASAQIPSPERTRAILEPAATQDGEEDTEHVRRFGIDDRDLFTDRREVSPDLIGDRPMPEDR